MVLPRLLHAIIDLFQICTLKTCHSINYSGTSLNTTFESGLGVKSDGYRGVINWCRCMGAGPTVVGAGSDVTIKLHRIAVRSCVSVTGQSKLDQCGGEWSSLHFMRTALVCTILRLTGTEVWFSRISQ